MAEPYYYVFLAEIEVTATTDDIDYLYGATPFTAPFLTSGPAYLRGDGSSDCILQMIRDAILDAGGVTPDTAPPVLFDIDPANVAHVGTITGDGGWTLQGTGTFDLSALGFASLPTVANGSFEIATSKSSKYVWVAPEPPVSDDMSVKGEVAQNRTPGGSVWTTELSGPHEDREMVFEMLDPARVFKTENTSDENAAFQAFWEYVRSGKKFEVHRAQINSGSSVLAALSSTTRIGTYHLAQTSAASWRPVRLNPGVGLYGFPLSLLNDGSGTSAPTGGVGAGAGGPQAYAGGNQSAASVQAFLEGMNGKASATPTAGGTLTINGQSLGSYDYMINSGNLTTSTFSAGDFFTSTEDSRVAAIYIDGNWTIDAGQTVIPSVRKLATFIYVDGNLAVNGGISMSSRGADHSSATGSNVTAVAIALDTGGTYSIPAAGGAGGTAAVTSSDAGDAGASGGTGGGGSGAGAAQKGGDGAAGTGFSGGPGGGACHAASGASPGSGAAAGGPGGAADGAASADRSAGGGAGNPGGAAYTFGGGAASAGDNGTGGIVVVFVTGTYSGSGTVTAHGADGGDAGGGTGQTYGGGGSGGGHASVLVLTGGTDGGGPTPTASGGAAGAGATVAGGAGGAGTAQVQTGV